MSPRPPTGYEREGQERTSATASCGPAPLRAETVGEREEIRFEDRLPGTVQGCLETPVGDLWRSPGGVSASCLGDHPLPDTARADGKLASPSARDSSRCKGILDPHRLPCVSDRAVCPSTRPSWLPCFPHRGPRHQKEKRGIGHETGNRSSNRRTGSAARQTLQSGPGSPVTRGSAQPRAAQLAEFTAYSWCSRHQKRVTCWPLGHLPSAVPGSDYYGASPHPAGTVSRRDGHAMPPSGPGVPGAGRPGDAFTRSLANRSTRGRGAQMMCTAQQSPRLRAVIRRGIPTGSLESRLRSCRNT